MFFPVYINWILLHFRPPITSCREQSIHCKYIYIQCRLFFLTSDSLLLGTLISAIKLLSYSWQIHLFLIELYVKRGEACSVSKRCQTVCERARSIGKRLKKTALQLNARTSLQKLKADSKISEQRAAQGLLCRILSVYKMKHPSILVIDC